MVKPLHMFSGAGAGGEGDKEAEAQAKAMGMSLKEYQLAMRMRENLTNALTAHRSSATSKGGEVEIVYDGNIKPVSVAISDAGLAMDKAQLESDVFSAWQDAIAGAQKAAQQNFQKMQKDITSELS